MADKCQNVLYIGSWTSIGTRTHTHARTRAHRGHGLGQCGLQWSRANQQCLGNVCCLQTNECKSEPPPPNGQPEPNGNLEISNDRLAARMAAPSGAGGFFCRGDIPKKCIFTEKNALPLGHGTKSGGVWAPLQSQEKRGTHDDFFSWHWAWKKLENVF